MILFLCAFFLLFGIVSYWLAMLIQDATKYPTYPRPARIMGAVKMGSELGWWSWQDMFGYKPLTPRPPEVPTLLTVEQLTETPEVRTVAHTATDVWNIPGLNG